MSRRINPTLIGLFIVTGAALGVGGVLLVSSSRLFTRSQEFVLYFDAALTGLDPGTAVKFRGVTVGHVKSVMVHYNQPSEDPALPVVIELNEDALRRGSDDTFNLTDETQLKAHIERGLRARLEAQSLLTGLLYVQLDYLPDVPLIYHQVRPLYRELPTAPSEVQIFRVDFADIARKLDSLLGRLDASLSEIQVHEINRGLTNLLGSLNDLAGSGEITNLLRSARHSLDEVRRLSVQLQARVDQLAGSADQTLGDSRAALVELRGGLQDARDLLAPNARLSRELTSTLEQMGEAARSIAELAEFLRRNPGALVSGRATPPDKP